MTLKWKLFQVTKNSYQKTKIGGLLRSILDLFKTFRLPKVGQLFGGTFMDVFNIKLKPKYKWKRIKKPHNSQSVQSFCTISFSSSVRCFCLHQKKKKHWHQWTELCSLRVTAKYRPLFWRTNFQTIWLRKEKKSWMFCCQNNRTSELFFVLFSLWRQP